jgi:glucosamine-6-phosphate deaminase
VNVRILKDEKAVARALAARVIATLAARPTAVLGLPTGRTPVQLYARLRAAYAAGRVDFAQATTFNLDEFLGLPGDHPASYRAFMETHLFKHVNLTRRRIHFLNGVAPDPVAECARYEAAIRRAGGIDLQILGIGSNGHIGFNEPAAGLIGDSHPARLAPGTRRSNADLFDGRVQAVPPNALSMGVGTILRSRAIVLVATGVGKAGAIKATVEGLVTTRVPASLLQLHGDVEVFLDGAAASTLTATKARRHEGAKTNVRR